MIGLTRAATLDNADVDIRVNAVAPVAYTALARPFLDEVSEMDRDALTPNGVARVVAYLAHSTCSLNGELLSAQAGRVSRIFTAVGPGFVHPGLTAEDLAAQLDKLMSTEGTELLPHALAGFSFLRR